MISRGGGGRNGDQIGLASQPTRGGGGEEVSAICFQKHHHAAACKGGGGGKEVACECTFFFPNHLVPDGTFKLTSVTNSGLDM